MNLGTVMRSTISERRRCDRCGSFLSREAIDGLCPQCIAQAVAHQVMAERARRVLDPQESTVPGTGEQDRKQNPDLNGTREFTPDCYVSQIFRE